MARRETPADQVPPDSLDCLEKRETPADQVAPESLDCLEARAAPDYQVPPDFQVTFHIPVPTYLNHAVSFVFLFCFLQRKNLY